MNTASDTDDIDNKLPIGKTLTLGLQHVLVMYAGAVTVPLIVGGALRLSTEELAALINADLLCCGVVSLLQALGLGKRVGIRLPVMMGVSYAGIGPMIAVGLMPGMGLPGLYGAIIAAGVIGFLLVPVVIRLLWLFPPLVTGTTLTSLGVGLLGVAIAWAGGGYDVPDFGNPAYLAVAAVVLAVTLLVARFARGFLGNIAVLAGIAAGMALAMALGKVTFHGLRETPWIEMVRPFQFGWPRFEWSAVATMVLVVIVTMVESIGLLFSLAIILNRNLSPADFARGLRADALGATIGGTFNAFPYTTYAQNIGLVGITGVRSRFVCVAASGILVTLALLPKMAHIIASIPHYVLGGAAIVMFGMVAASGVRILQSVDFKSNKHNMFIFAISLGAGLIPTLSPKFFDAFPPFLSPLLHSGVLLTVVAAVILNLFFNGMQGASVQLDGETRPRLDAAEGQEVVQ
ncbi:nucleobase:cation symporter-2 family protein [Paraburkholderia oxyphila]|uniref:nucleobase:cation symporter-2 family protein n=1 Tax=Paraburkholderia oxyphila TaxID=614212 RepID=UPI0005BCF7B8|nr:nucleobase:cation symporter-2 family protein [Paraburkholderia oxyphila]